jgi:NaMN:DMB phosphoribosyltransferase
VLALALNEIEPESRSELFGKILIGTTSWLVDESLSSSENRNSFIHLMNHVANHFKVNILGLASGYRFNDSKQQVLRDYEIGYVKEGVGAGALSLLAQIKGLTQKEMIQRCDIEVSNLFKFDNEKPVKGSK